MKLTLADIVFIAIYHLPLFLTGGEAGSNESGTTDLQFFNPWSTEQPRYSAHLIPAASPDPLALILDDLPNTTQTISITGNEQILSLEANIFSRFRELNRAVLNHNAIQVVSPTAFEGCPITLLDLSYNKLTGLPNLNSISGTLEKLILRRNPLQTVTFDGWEPFPRLEYIDFVTCDLLEMPRLNVSVTMPKLEQLLLFNNRISGLVLGDLVSFLRFTRLARNNISQLPSTVGQSYPTTRLQLQCNDLTNDGVSDKSFAGFHKMKIFSVAYNHFTQFPNLTYIGSTISTFNISFNHLDHLALDCMTSLVALRELRMEGNLFERFPNFTLAGLPKQNKLQQIFLDSNKISYLEPSAMVNLHALEVLTLNGNNIKTVISLAEVSPFLHHLEVGENNIVDIADDTLAELSLHTLNISYNNITKIPNLIKSQSSLTCLDLSFNPMNSLTSAYELATMMTSFQNIQYLYLEGIGLTTLPEMSFDHLKELHIGNNSLVCTQELCWIKNIQEKGRIVTGMSHIYCNISGDMIEWNLVSPESLCTKASSLAVAVSSVWNFNEAELAIDGNIDTCAVTGYESNPWLRLKFTEQLIVNGSNIKGWLPEGHMIIARVGNIGNDIGPQARHQENPICFSTGFDMLTTDIGSYSLQCSSPLLGLYLYVEGFDDKGNIGQLAICEISVF